MSILDPIIHTGARLVLEGPGSQASLAHLASQLNTNGDKLTRRLGKKKDTLRNRKLLAHIIGIERWGQRRLRFLLGEPLLKDEYDRYRPPSSLGWDALQAQFQSARGETVALACEIDRQRDIPSVRIPHNQFGPLTPQGWLRYLDIHANAEAAKLK